MAGRISRRTKQRISRPSCRERIETTMVALCNRAYLCISRNYSHSSIQLPSCPNSFIGHPLKVMDPRIREDDNRMGKSIHDSLYTASRAGRSDFGVNRKRVERMRAAQIKKAS